MFKHLGQADLQTLIDDDSHRALAVVFTEVGQRSVKKSATDDRSSDQKMPAEGVGGMVKG